MVPLCKNIVIGLLVLLSRDAYSQTVSVAATKTNVLYQWVENPLKIAVENNPCSKIAVKADQGKVKGSGCDYIYVALSDTIKDDVIKVGLKQNGKIRWISTSHYYVQKMPDPVVSIGHYTKSGPANKNYILAQSGLTVAIQDGFCSYTNEQIQELRGYSLTVYRGDSLLYSENCHDNFLTAKARDFIKSTCRVGDKIIFDNFNCLLYKKEERKLTQKMEITLN